MSLAAWTLHADDKRRADMHGRVMLIGGGISALAFAIRYRELGGEVLICERNAEDSADGLGFILQENGLRALERLGLGAEALASGCRLDECRLFKRCSMPLKYERMKHSVGIRRRDLISAMRRRVPREWISYGRKFEGFLRDHDRRISAAGFGNGTSLTADLYIGCDGAYSRVRRELFPERCLVPPRVKEIVSTIPSSAFGPFEATQFSKLLDPAGGLAVGYLPCSRDEIVWFVQFDADKHAFEGGDPGDTEHFVRTLLEGWAPPVQKLIEGTDFSRSRLCNTTYLPPLQHYHRGNVALIGDAAHPMLTFTSQGVSTGIEDAIALADILIDLPADHIETALLLFSAKRSPRIAPFVERGVALQEQFLKPPVFGELAVPLVN